MTEASASAVVIAHGKVSPPTPGTALPGKTTVVKVLISISKAGRIRLLPEQSLVDWA
jgi:hypothetical protein